MVSPDTAHMQQNAVNRMNRPANHRLYEAFVTVMNMLDD